MNESPPGISPVTRLFELAARSLHSAGYAEGLYPAQWSCLRYLAAAAPNDRTAAKLARFQQLAMGPVTRTVRTLVQKGLVSEGGAAEHHRSKKLDLTAAAIELLARDPLHALDVELAKLPSETTRALADALAIAIASLHRADGAGDETLDAPLPKIHGG